MQRQMPQQSECAAKQYNSKCTGTDPCHAPCLFAFPLESNFSGVRYDPAVISQIQTAGLAVERSGHETSSIVSQQTNSQSTKTAQATQHYKAARQQGEEEEQTEQSLQPDRHADKQQPAVSHGLHARAGKREKEDEEAQASRQEEGKEDSRVEEEGIEGSRHEEEGEGTSSRQAEEDVGRGSHRWHVLVDAAKACASSPPDLTKHRADFVVSTLALTYLHRHSFIPSFVHSFVHSFIRSFVHSFICSFLYSFIHSVVHSFFRSFIHLFIPSFISLYACASQAQQAQLGTYTSNQLSPTSLVLC